MGFMMGASAGMTVGTQAFVRTFELDLMQSVSQDFSMEHLLPFGTGPLPGRRISQRSARS